MGRGERLVDVDVHHVEAGLAGLEAAHDGVEVRPVHVGQGASLVDGLEQLAQARLEEAQRGRVGDHHGRRPRPERGPERLHVHAAIGSGRDRDGLEARHGRGGGVGAVGRIRDQHLGPLQVAAAAVVGPDHEDAGQLALGAGRRLERDRLHATDLGQRLLQLPQQLQRPLGQLIREPADGAPRSRAAGRPTR